MDGDIGLDDSIFGDEPEEPQCTITGDRAVLSAQLPEDYADRAYILLLAAYDNAGRMVGITSEVTVHTDGSYEMTVRGENIVQARLFTLNEHHMPIGTPCSFE